MSFCPKCRREFPDSGGFCPFDGVALTVAGQRSTPVGNSTDILENRASELARPLAPATYDHLVGATLEGRYHIEKKIGEGGMGVVFLAHHVVIEKPVAIKILRREVALDRSVVKRFVQEARAASRIGHPNIIDVTDFGTTPDGMTYQVMEYIEGLTLSELLKEKETLDLPRALNIVAQIGRALDAAHDKGIIHRDLKPDNVFLVDREGRPDFVKIVDFGIAKVAPADGKANEPRLTRVGSVFGTPEYMAPEQAAGRPDVDRRADVYALATILYEMLVGRVPHKGETTVRTLAMQMLDPVDRPRLVKADLAISDDLETTIMKALSKKRHDRFATMSEFLDALEDVTSDTELNLPLVVSQERDAVDPPASIAPENADDTDVSADAPETSEDSAQPRISDAVRPSQLLDSVDQPRRRKPRRTDPAFLQDTSGLPIFDEVSGDDESSQDEYAELPAPPRRRWPLIALLLLLAAGGAVVAFVLMQPESNTSTGDNVVTAAADAGQHRADTAAHDAAAEATTDSDAGTRATVAVSPGHGKKADAAAGAHVVEPTDPTGRDGKDTTKPDDKTSTGKTTKLGPEVEVTVRTSPPGGELFIKDGYAGSDGLNVRRPSGTVLTVACKSNGYDAGSVKIRFGADEPVYLCRMRKQKCTQGLMNPFEKCPD